uniref:WAP domain-containing protein n=1 Tax=Salarias fasciatus TaxID=181472 RepID=A0A672ITR6_SALFA
MYIDVCPNSTCILVCKKWRHGRSPVCSLCTDPDSVFRPGACPRFFWQKDLICALNVKPVCRFDFHCPFDHKCCRNQCGAVCMLLSHVDLSSSSVKNGVCPRFNLVQNVRCSGLRRCIRDNNCPRSLKCCYNRCGRVCVRPQNTGEM